MPSLLTVPKTPGCSLYTQMSTGSDSCQGLPPANHLISIFIQQCGAQGIFSACALEKNIDSFPFGIWSKVSNLLFLDGNLTQSVNTTNNMTHCFEMKVTDACEDENNRIIGMSLGAAMIPIVLVLLYCCISTQDKSSATDYKRVRLPMSGGAGNSVFKTADPKEQNSKEKDGAKTTQPQHTFNHK